MMKSTIDNFHSFHLHIKNIPSEENIEEILKLYMESESNTKKIILSFNKNKKEALIQYIDSPKNIHEVIGCINNRQLFRTTMSAKPAIFKKRLILKNLQGIIENDQELQIYLEQKNLQPDGLNPNYEVKVKFDALNHVAIATLPNNADINKYISEGKKYIGQNVIIEQCDYFTTLQDLIERKSPKRQNKPQNVKSNQPSNASLQDDVENLNLEEYVGGAEGRRGNRGHNRRGNRARGYRGRCRVEIEGVEKHIDNFGQVIYEGNLNINKDKHNSSQHPNQQRPNTSLNQNQPYSSNSYLGYDSQNSQLDHHSNKKLVGADQMYNITRGNQNRYVNRGRKNPCLADALALSSNSYHGKTDQEPSSQKITAENLNKLNMQHDFNERPARNAADGNKPLQLQHRSHSQSSLLSNSSHLSQPVSLMGMRINPKLKPGQIYEMVKVCNESKKKKVPTATLR